MPLKTRVAWALAILAVTALLYVDFPLNRRTLGPTSQPSCGVTSKSRFSWADALSTTTLNWEPCYDGRECTRLSVPLDYENPHGRQASIALVRKKASVPHTSSSYKGPILVNPGGPGGSGVDMVRGPAGDLLSRLVGPQFDIVSFDPRGIARSTPVASFFKQAADRTFFLDNERASYAENHEDVGLLWSRGQVIGKLAQETDDGYLPYINTDHTARDMLSIVRAHGRERLQYWGFSYGSILGATFASMFPDSVERLIIDGVVDAESYYTSEYATDFMDADKVMDVFYSGCAQAGPETCNYWAPSADDIRKNLTELYKNLATKPIPVVENGTHGVFTKARLGQLMLMAMYKPYTLFPFLGQHLADPVQHARALYEASGPLSLGFKCECDSDTEYLPRALEAFAAVACNDADPVPDDLQSALDFYDDLKAQAPDWAPAWTQFRLMCSGWPKHQKKRFRGPFSGNTSHPLLIIGNTADPVTPIWNAFNMTKGFTGSVVLTQDSAGHASISAPSLCTAQYVRRYFLDGTLPPPGTVCSPDRLPFDLSPPLNPHAHDDRVDASGVRNSAQEAFLSSLSADQLELYHTVAELSQATVIRPPLGLF